MLTLGCEVGVCRVYIWGGELVSMSFLVQRGKFVWEEEFGWWRAFWVRKRERERGRE